MIYLWYGEEDYFIQQNLGKIRERMDGASRELNYGVFAGAALDWPSLLTQLQTPPFLAAQRFVVIEEQLGWISKQKKEELFLKTLHNMAEGTHLVVIEKSLDKRKKLTKSLMQLAEVKEYPALDLLRARRWLATYAQQHQVPLSGPVQEILLQRVGLNAWQLSQEVQKLALFHQPEQPLIPEHLELLVSPTEEEKVFELLDAIALRQGEEAYSLLQQSFRSGSHPLQLLRLLTNHFRRLLFMRDALDQGQSSPDLLVKLLATHPYAAKKIAQQVRRFRLKELQERYLQLADADWDIKRGHITGEMALELFVVA